MGYIKASAPPTIGNVTRNTGEFSTVGVGAAAVTSALYVNAPNRIGAWVTGTNISSGADADGIFVDASFAPSASITNAASIGLFPTFNPGGGVTIATGYGLYVAAGTQGGAGAVTTGYGLFVTHPAFGTTNYAAQIDNLRVDLNSITATNTNGSVSVLSDGTGAANFGTNATAHTTTLGSTTTTATTAVQSGSGGITIATSSNGTIGITSGTGVISLSADATNTTVNLATGGGVKLTTVGSTNGASSLTLNAGSAGIIMPSLTGILTANGASKLTASTVTQHGVLVGGASNAVSSTGVGSTGQVLQGNTGANPTYSTATFPSTATSTGTILRADGTNWVATTATYPTTTTAQQILYSSTNNVIDQITTANNGILVTSSSGVPSILAGPGTTGNILQSNAAAAPSFSTATYPSTTAANTMLISTSANVVTTTTFIAATTFTPILKFGGGTTGITYTTQYGKYQQVGNCVTFALFLDLSSKGSSTGNATITGIPVTSATDTGNYAYFMEVINGGVAATTVLWANLPQTSTTLILFADNTATGATTNMNEGNFNNNSSIRISGSYFV